MMGVEELDEKMQGDNTAAVNRAAPIVIEFKLNQERDSVSALIGLVVFERVGFFVDFQLSFGVSLLAPVSYLLGAPSTNEFHPPTPLHLIINTATY